MADPNRLDIEIDVGVRAEALRSLEAGLERQIVVARALGKDGTADLKRLETSLVNVRGELAKVGGAGSETAQASDLIDQFGRRGGDAAHAVEGLDAALRGGFQGGLIGGARAIHAMRDAFESTVGMVSIAIGVIGIAGAKIAELWQEARAEEAKNAADAAKTHFEQLGKAIETVNHARMEEITKQIAALKDEAALALAALKALDEAKDKQTSAEGAADIQAIKNNPNLSEAQKVEQIAAIEQRERAQKRDHGNNERYQEQVQASASQQQAQELANRAAADKAAKDKASTAAEAALLEAKRAPENLGAAQEQLKELHTQNYDQGTPEMRQEYKRVWDLIFHLQAINNPIEVDRRTDIAGLAAKDKAGADTENDRAQKELQAANQKKALLAAQDTPEVVASRIAAQNAEDREAAEKLKPELAKAKLEDQKRAAEKLAEGYAAKVDAGVEKYARNPDEAAAVTHVREQAQKIGQDGASAAGLDALSKATKELADAAVAAHDKNVQLYVNTALAVRQQADRLRQIEQQLRDHLAH